MIRQRKTYQFIEPLMMVLMLVLSACSHSGEDDGKDTACYLNVYVYSPAQPMPTRTDMDYVNAKTAENTIHTLQIWVFKHHTGALLGYLEVEPQNQFEGQQYQVIVDPEIAEGTSEERRVDVYVLGNVYQSNCGLSFNRSTTRDELNAATLAENCFDVRTPTSVVPAEGLPMSGVLKNEPVSGSFPILRIGTENQMSTVKLVRAVSKLRFILCRVHEEEDTSCQLEAITGISLHGNQIPQKEYLMLNSAFDGSLNPSDPLADSRIHILPNSYVEDAISFTPPEIANIPIVEDPLVYIYDHEKYASMQAYEDALDAAIASTPPSLVELGLTYLRESDQKLKGTISYRVASDSETTPDRTTEFEMSRAGDFSRDHSWIIYVFFSGGKLQVFNIVQVGIKNWDTTNDQPEEHKFYNW
mgnify:CR=1 FL=1